MSTTLGHGWTHNYKVELKWFDYRHININAYVITDESGRIHHYRDLSGGGIYTGFLSTNGKLVVEPDGSLTWHRPNNVRYKFNQLLQFITKEDDKGNVQSLTYDTDNRLETVTDEATGRTIGFHYNPDNRIDHMTGPITAAIPDGVWVRYGYDAAGNLAHVEYAEGSGFQYEYEDLRDPHNMTEKLNLSGEFISSWQYDYRDRVLQNITRDGKGVTLSYDNNKVVVTDAHGVKKTYTIASVYGLRTITNVTGGGCASCGGDAVRYGYDNSGRVNEIEYANGRIDLYADFDVQNRYQTEIQAFGAPEERTFYYDYHPDTGERLRIVEISTLATGNKEITFDYDDDGNELPNENPTLRRHRKIERGYTYSDSGALRTYEYVTTYAYDSKGRVTAVDGPLPGDQDRITYTYDPVTGDLLSETRPLIGTTIYEYDAVGNAIAVTDPDGIVTTFTYDGRNRQLSSTRAGITVSRSYNAAGELESTTDALSRTMDYAYNAAGFLEQITDPSGNFIYYGYNSTGRRTVETIHAAGGERTHYRGYDYGTAATNPAISSGKPWKSLHRNAADTADLATTYVYDASGNLTVVTDANGNATYYRYDLFERLIEVEQPGGAFTTYAYDLHGNLTSVTDAEGRFTTYIYDDLGRLIETDSPDTGTTRYSYDAAGNLRYKVQNEGQTTEYRYDALGRLTRILYGDPAEDVTLTYDSGSGANLIGRLASVTDAAGTTHYSYDPDGRVISETRTIEGLTFVTGYAYDQAGTLREIHYPTGQIVAYQPDAADPARTGAVILNESRILASNLSYLPFGPLSALTLGNGLDIAKTFDPNYQVKTIAHGTLLQRGYSVDNVGNITAIADNLDATRSQAFGYDDQYRLTSATGKYGMIAYTYDKVGNRRSRTHGSLSDSYDYYQGTNRLQSVIGTHAELSEYDDDGNTIRRTPGAGNPTPPITDPNTYNYDSSGRRVKKTGQSTTLFHFDHAGQLLAETDTAGDLIKAYVWLDGRPLAMLTPGNTVHYYHNDHLGTPQKMTDATCTVVWAADYLPFGEVDVTVAGVENNLRFAGQYFDNETGLHYNYWRYYDPKIGRYLRADPIGLEGGVNLYFYVQGNPLSFNDPLGLYGKDVHLHMTETAALMAGYSYCAAAEVADADQAVDIDHDPINPINVNERALWHFPSSERIQELKSRAYSSCSLIALGEALHVVQDSFSHAGFAPTLGHFYVGTTPDNFNRNINKTGRMLRETDNVLKTFLGRCESEAKKCCTK